MPQIVSLITKFDDAAETCEVAAVSVFTRKLHKMILPITRKQFLAWQNGVLIQNAMPNLTPSQREFLLTGSTDEEWDEEFGDDE